MQSGEIYARNNLALLVPKFSGPLAGFSKFLELDCQQRSSIQIQDEISSIRLNNRLMISAHKSYIAYLTESLIKFLGHSTSKVRIDSLSRCQRIMMLLRRSKSSNESSILQSILSYFAILKEELNASRAVLSHQNADIDCLRRQAKLFKTVKQFALCIGLETKSRITLTALLSDSTQSKRCRKAVTDNVNRGMMEQLGFTAMDVVNVFKLDHQILSERLQVGQRHICTAFRCISNQKF